MNNINLITHEETKAIQEAFQAARQEEAERMLAEMQSRNAGITGDLIPVAQAESLPQLFGERDENGYAKILGIIENIEKQASSIVFDITTKEGQATCRSLAAKIAKAKTAIDKAGKEKKDEFTVFTKRIDEDRNLAKNRMQYLQDTIRQPLTAMEEAEKNRIAGLEQRLASLDYLNSEVPTGFVEDSAVIQRAIDKLQNTVIGDDWQEFQFKAMKLKDDGLARLSGMLEASLKYEAEQAELNRLREAEAERIRTEREAQIAKEAEERAKAEAEAKAKAEIEKVQREAQRAIMEAEAKQRYEAEEKAKRERNLAHRREINIDAYMCFIEAGFDAKTAEQVVQLIANGKIKNITINY